MSRKLKLIKWLAIIAASAYATKQLLRASRLCNFANKVVLISGGSRGLGLVMARQLAKEGAKLALIARNTDKLEEAETELQTLGADVYTVSCDIADRRQVDAAVAAVIQKFGHVDVLINDAGTIEVGPMETMNVDDYSDAMNVHYWGPLYLSLAVLPIMRQRKTGRIVNISSIGGKISVPHLLPYCASKFALVGLSEGMREELLKDNVFVTTVCPGMMRTGSHINAYFKGHNAAEYAWFSIFNSLPLFSISAEKAAAQVIEACRRGDPELTISLQAQLAIKLYQLLPGLCEDIAGTLNRFMPGPNGKGSMKILGRNSFSWAAPSRLTELSDAQVVRNNEA